MKVLEPGWFAGMSEETYFGDPVPVGSLSQSGARLLLPPYTPHHFDHYRRNPRPANRAQQLGTAAHARVLGLGAQVVVMPEVIDGKAVTGYTTNKVKALRDKALAEGKVPLLKKENDQVEGMAAALRRHRQASALLRPGEGAAEVSVFWVDPETGVWLRMRTDWLPVPREDGRVVLVDYKTSSRQADRASFSRAIWEYGYYIQGPWYQTGVGMFEELSPYYEPDFVWIVQESAPPYAIGLFELEPEDVEWGRKQARRAIREYARCAERAEWPSHPAEIVRAGLPRYAHYQLNDMARDGAFYDPEYDGHAMPGTITPARTYDDTYRGWDV